MAFTISSMFTARLLRAAEAAGHDVRSLWGPLGFAPDHGPPGGEFPPIDDAVHLRVWEAVLDRAGEAFVVEFSSSLEVDDYGLLGVACRTAPTLRAALALLLTHIPTFLTSTRFERYEAGADTVLAFTRAGPPTRGARAAIESTVVELVAAFRELTGAPMIPRRVGLAHRRGASAAAHHAYLGVMPVFAAGGNELVYPRAAYDTPLRRRDPAAHRYLRDMLGKIAAAQRGRPGELAVRERVHRAIVARFPATPTLAVVARQLATSPRSLQRALGAEGTSFVAAVDAARREVAEVMLQDGRHTQAEVAAAVGYAEASALSRARRRWRGHPRR